MQEYIKDKIKNHQIKWPIKNSLLVKELVDSHNQNKLTEKAILMFMLMTDKILSKFYWEKEEWREDCFAYAILKVYDVWEKYDVEKSYNAFSYFTQVIKNAIYYQFKEIHGKSKSPSKRTITYSNILDSNK